MGQAIRFEVEGNPQSKQRARVGKFGTRTPKATVLAENLVKIRALDAIGDDLPAGPLRVDMVAVYSRPQSMRRRKDPDGPVWHTKRGDVDNVLKMALDGMGPLFDDCRVAQARAIKVYTAKDDDRARIIIEVGHVDDTFDAVRQWSAEASAPV